MTVIVMTNSPVQPASAPRAASWKWLAGTLFIVLIRALPNVRYLIGRDQATYCVIGQSLWHGKLLYRDLWDNKPPGIFYLYAPIVKIFGPVMWSVGVVDILWLLVFSCCLFYFVRRYLGEASAALAAIFYACRHCRQGYIHAVQPEAFLLLCVLGAWFLLSEEKPSASPVNAGHTAAGLVARCFAAGLLLGAAFWLKYSAIAFFPFVALVPFVDFSPLQQRSARLRLLIRGKDWLGRVSVVVAGILLAVAAVLGGFYVSGAWPAMREIQFEILPRYGAMAFHWSFYYGYWALWQTQNHMGVWWEMMPALGLAIALWRRDLDRIAPLALMALAGYLSTAMQGRFHPYYFETCYPFVAVFWGYVLVKAWDGFVELQRLFARRQWTLARGLLWVVFAALAFSLLPEETVRTWEQYRFAADWWKDPEASYKTYYWQLPLEKIGDQMRVIDYLQAHSRPRDEVYVWGTAPLINFLSQRESPSRFVSNLGLMSAWVPERWRQELVSTLKASHPRYLVVERHDQVPTLTFTTKDSEQYLQVFPGLAGLLQTQYRPAADYMDFEIYQLKNSPESDARDSPD